MERRKAVRCQSGFSKAKNISVLKFESINPPCLPRQRRRGPLHARKRSKISSAYPYQWRNLKYGWKCTSIHLLHRFSNRRVELEVSTCFAPRVRVLMPDLFIRVQVQG